MLSFKKRIITFDIGGTNISGGVVEFRKKECVFLNCFNRKNPRNSREIKKILLSKSEELKKKYKTKKIAISSAKIIDNKKKIVLQAKPVYGVDKFSFSFLEKNKFSVEIENDGACFAKGEYFFGKGQGAGLLTLALGTGIGGGFINQEGEVLRGKNNSALEFSYVKIKKGEKWIRWCEIASGSGIEKNFLQKTGKKIKAEEIFKLEKKGDESATEAIKEAQEFLGVGVANLINIFDPEKIIFGGGLSEQKKFIKESIAIAKRNIFNKKGKYKFEISELGRKSNQLGAASLYF